MLRESKSPTVPHLDRAATLARVEERAWGTDERVAASESIESPSPSTNSVTV